MSNSTGFCTRRATDRPICGLPAKSGDCGRHSTGTFDPPPAVVSSGRARDAATAAALSEFAASAPASPGWNDDGDEAADASWAAASRACTTALHSRLTPGEVGRAAAVAAGPSILRAEKLADTIASSYEAWGLNLSDDDQQAVMAGVVAARGEDTDEHAVRFAAAQERARKALDEEPLAAEPDAAFVNAYDTVDEVAGSVMTRAEVQAMAESAALATSGPGWS